ncbi:MAG: GNAT family N-acetyltransferase [Candidatus Thorarchaeota archaeon]|jgi:RimJ/RimL family protein N-acetyltransferase
MTDEFLSDGRIHLKPVLEEDLEILMAWRSHPDVYQYFSNQTGPLTWEEHILFWNSRVDRIDWIIHLDDGTRVRKVGSVNVSQLSERVPEVGIFIGEITLMRKNIATSALKLVIEWLKARGYSAVVANIQRNNYASQKLFTKTGFRLMTENDDEKELRYINTFDQDHD